jgi:hypothetical protein
MTAADLATLIDCDNPFPNLSKACEDAYVAIVAAAGAGDLYLTVRTLCFSMHVAA